MVSSDSPVQLVGLSVSGIGGRLDAVGAPMQAVFANSGQLDGSPGFPFGKRSASCDGIAGKPQMVRLTAASGTSWVMSETVKLRP